ncbi:MAG: GGDEF domain-containing protein [Granulosicoccus sp.]|nr:GGDEF domain-containing protein [Granulosicoccus sp.]
MNSETAQDCSDDIWQSIAACEDLPTPPGIAAQLIDLAQSDDTDFDKVEALVKLDPAITVKLLRLANSSFYSRGRKIENLRQAIGQFGLNGTLIIALTFSLVKVPQKNKTGLNHNLYWLRALASAIICRRLSQLCAAGAQESFYLAGLLQDIGILVLDAVVPELYEDLADFPSNHQTLSEAEEAAVGINHSDVGAWLLEHWKFPQLYVDATAASHSLQHDTVDSEIPLLGTCVAISSYLADLWVMSTVTLPQEVGPIISNQLELDDEIIRQLVQDVQSEISDVAELFDLTLMDDTQAALLLTQARDAFTLRSLSTEQALSQVNRRVKTLEQHTAVLEHKLDFDELTGVHSRTYAYKLLDNLFPQADQHQSPISLIFVDLDDFKKINDQHGHSVGDKTLRWAAQTLKKAIRTEDVVARAGGEEFLIVLSDTGYVNASNICDRLINLLSSRTLVIDDNLEIHVTASIGLSVHGETTQFKDIYSLIDSADMACYKAKTGGKNRWVFAET